MLNFEHSKGSTVFHNFKFYYLYSSVLDIEVACYGYEGIDAVKEALRAGLNCSTENMPIKVSACRNSEIKSKVFLCPQVPVACNCNCHHHIAEAGMPCMCFLTLL